MKKKSAIIGLVLFLFFLSGCLFPSLHPIFTEKDLVFNKNLLGTWKNPKNNDIVQFEKASPKNLKEFNEPLKKQVDKIYMLTNKDSAGNVKSKYYVFLVRLGNKYYIDYYPAETDKQNNYDGFFTGHFIKMHLFYNIHFVTNQALELKQFDKGFLEDLIKKKQIRIKHEIMDDGTYFITASTEELQQYLIKYSDVPKAYEEDIITYSRIN